MILRIRQMLVKEFLQMFRDTRMRLVVLVMPLVQLTVLAFALTTDVKNISTAVVDPDHTAESRDLVSSFSGGGYFHITHRFATDSHVRRLMDAGTVRAVIRIPQGFSADLRAGRTVALQLIVDGTLSNDSAITLSYASQAIATFNRRRATGWSAAPPADPAAVEVRIRAWYNPNLESKYYYVPGLIAVMLILIGLVLTSMAIVREKEIGTIEQVMVTPIRRVEFIIGKTLPFLLTGMVTMTMMFIIARFLFDIRIQGSVTLLYATAGIYILGNLGLALLVSVTARTQQQALLTAFLILMPTILLSGFIFPIRNMPDPVQWATIVNPMRWFLQILHGIVVKGVGIRTLWLPIIAQIALAGGFLALAVGRFKKTLE
ncbi:transport permease protein [Desulfosarcina alkanivorans]|uniref:Transport permease protein n=1 Tax=Desulfosarcina alkanivorans TaxID=571177 RepID=A0A5K7YUX8_9BACT|nr:ABC transporter permease [Desulfosarcina alkanivorans]BBO72120.1 transport permease protein [Desulfosarcina alkanivorans]